MSIDDKIINYYDEDFNKKYNTNRRLNTEIMSKNALIEQNEWAANAKSQWIAFLSYALMWFVYFYFITLCYSIGVYNRQTYMWLVVISLIIMIYLMLRIHFWNQFVRGAEVVKKANIRAAKETIATIGEVILPHYMIHNNCPENCPFDPIQSPRIKDSNVADLKTDLTHNDWADGDLSEVNIKGGQPKPWFKSVSQPTKYTCVWNGFGDRPELKTTIPCSYYPGYSNKSN